MIKYNPLISICIPTYNKCERLKECLYNIIEKVGKYRLAIFISDNASTDATGKYIEEIRQIYPYIFYSKNDENLGFDRNVEKVLKMSTTRYRWLFGDDDLILKDAMDEILDQLHDEQYDLIVCNRNIGKYTQIAPREYIDSNSVLAELGANMTWISVLIFSEDMVTRSNFNKYIGSCFVHLGIVFEYLAKKKVNVFWSTHTIVIENQKSIGCFRDNNFEIFTDKLIEVVEMLPSFYENKNKCKCIRVHAEEFLGGQLKFLVLSRIVNRQLDIVIFLKKFKNIKKTFSATDIILGFLISIMPRYILNNIIWIYKNIKIIGKRVQRYGKNN